MTRSNKIVNGSSVFTGINNFVMLIIAIIMVYPFYNLIIVSLLPIEYPMTKLYLFPPAITFGSYGRVLGERAIINGFIFTVFRTLLGIAIPALAIIFAAYPLSRRYFPDRTFWTAFIVFTMFFSGGLIPSYLLVRDLGLRNTVWSLILPGMIPTFSMLIVRNFFMVLPDSLEESARIDGANDIIILFFIILPISLPIIATVILWQAVAHWNAWFDALIYIDQNQANKTVLQIVLRRIIISGTKEMVSMDKFKDAYKGDTDAIKAATIMVATIPIIIVYPFLQKYFVKGVLVGSLKG